jgi:ABC-type dipeptide/oligopeptide/nickel transport system ATPase subunit
MSLVEAHGMYFRYPSARRSGARWTIEDLDVSIPDGSSVGIVGESGSGKSTLVRVLCGLLHHEAGRVEFDGREIGEWLRADSRELRRRNQIVFQSPRRSLDPRMTIARSLKEPMRAIERRSPTRDELVAWLEQVGLAADVLPRFPHQLSGGQLQRVSIARALSVRPDVLYADEPTSALDVSVRAQVLNLLMQLRAELGLTLVMVSHDLAVISRMCEHLVVMKDGKILEAGAMADILSSPATAYTAALVDAARSVSLRV